MKNRKSNASNEVEWKHSTWVPEVARRISALIDRFDSTREAAKLLGVHPDTVSRWRNGESSPPFLEIGLLASKKGVSLDWIFSGEESGEPLTLVEVKRHSAAPGDGALGEFVLIPRYDVRAAAGHGTEIEREEIVARYAFRRDWLHRMGLQADQLALITAYGESMEPDIRDGAMILVDLRQKSIEREGIYVLNVDSWLMAKIVQRDVDGTLYIRSRHPAYRELVVPKERVSDVRVIGRAVWSDRILS